MTASDQYRHLAYDNPAELYCKMLQNMILELMNQGLTINCTCKLFRSLFQHMLDYYIS